MRGGSASRKTTTATSARSAARRLEAAGRYAIPDTGEPEHVFVAGDVHGDMAALEGFLLASGVAEPVAAASDGAPARWKWVAPRDTAMVFVGDIVDRWRPGQEQTQCAVVQLLQSGAMPSTKRPTKLRLEGNNGCSFRVRAAKPSKNTARGLLVEIDRDGDDPELEKGQTGTLVWDRADAYGVSLKAKVRVVRVWLPMSLGEYVGEEKQILETINDLQRQAKAAGSRLVKVIGNHEAWTCMGDYGYATPAGKQAWPGGKERAAEVARLYLEGGDTHAVVRLGRWVFAHAGITTRWLEAMHQAIGAVSRRRDDRRHGHRRHSSPEQEVLDEAEESRSRHEDDEERDGDEDGDEYAAGGPRDPCAGKPTFVFEVANAFARKLLEEAARGGAEGAIDFLGSSKIQPLTEAMINNKEAIWLTRSLGSSEAVVNPRFVEDLFSTLGLDVHHDRLVCGHNVQFARERAANPRFMDVRGGAASPAARKAGVEVDAFEGHMGKRKAPHGINFALPQVGGGGALGFVDVGASRAFNMGEGSCDPDVIDARAYQVLAWDRKSNRTRVLRVHPDLADASICGTDHSFRAAVSRSRSRSPTPRRGKSARSRRRNHDGGSEDDDGDDDEDEEPSSCATAAPPLSSSRLSPRREGRTRRSPVPSLDDAEDE